MLTKKNFPENVMLFGIGASTQSVLNILKKNNIKVSTYLLRESATYGPTAEATAYSIKDYPNPCPLIREQEIDLVIPMSIDWFMMPWCKEFIDMQIPILSPTGRGMLLERDRDLARRLCDQYNIPFPKSFVAKNRIEAEKILQNEPSGYVIKNPLCSPTSPIHTIMCETIEDTRSWLNKINYEEGVFLQKYLGRREAGHIAFVAGGEIHSLVTNQEYKHAFNGDMGVIAGAPLGGIIEQDPDDKYNLAKELLHPLLPWFKKVNFSGPVQVTAINKNDKWHVIEYNVRIGVTCGPIILKMMENPVEVLWDIVNNRTTSISFKPDLKIGVSLTLAGYGYPFGQVKGPNIPVVLDGEPTCDIWWNEVTADEKGNIFTNGQRIADLVAIEASLEQAIAKVYQNIKKIRCSNSYYRTDIGQTKWPPGEK